MLVGGPAKPLSSKKRVQYDWVRKRVPTKIVCPRLPRASQKPSVLERSPSPISSDHDEPPPLVTRPPQLHTQEPIKGLRRAIIIPWIYGVTKPNSSFLPPPVPCSSQNFVGENTKLSKTMHRYSGKADRPAHHIHTSIPHILLGILLHTLLGVLLDLLLHLLSRIFLDLLLNLFKRLLLRALSGNAPWRRSGPLHRWLGHDR